MLMDVLLVAVGFSGALTLLWLGRLLARLVRAPGGAAIHFAPGAGPIDAVVRELAAARSEVLLMAGALACRPVAQALVDARLRHVQVEVLLDEAAEEDAASDLHFLAEQGLVPLLATSPSGLHGPVVVVDGKCVLCGSSELTGTELSGGQMLVVRGNAALVAECREQFARRREPARAVGGMAATSPVKEEKADENAPEPAARPPVPAGDRGTGKRDTSEIDELFRSTGPLASLASRFTKGAGKEEADALTAGPAPSPRPPAE